MDTFVNAWEIFTFTEDKLRVDVELLWWNDTALIDAHLSLLMC